MAKAVFVFVPAFGQIVTATTFLTTHNLQQALNKKGISGGISCLSYPDIAELRNIALTMWYDTLPFSHLLFIDADIGFDPQMVVDMILFDEPVVGCMYPKRTYPLQWAASGTGEDELERRGGFMSLAGVGMGCTLISRDAIRIMLEKMPELSDPRIEMHSAKSIFDGAGVTRLIRAFDLMQDPDVGRISEDLAFCRRVRECGMKVWASIAYRVQHVGPHVFEGSYLEHVEQRERQKADENADAVFVNDSLKEVSAALNGGSPVPA